MKALYDIISEAIVDGELPEDFHLPETTIDGNISWADGAMDGVGVYHMGTRPIGELQLLLVGNAMDAAGAGDFEKAEHCLREAVSGKLGDGYALCIMDDMQRYIIKNAEKLSPQNVFQFAMHQILTSDHKECVKLGLAILELIKSDIDVKIKSHIMTVALSDEFTLFAIYAISKWDNANDYIFQLAKKVHGWGRVHAVAALKPDTEEIKDWLIKEGVHNGVMAAYSAYECWSKGDAEARLVKELDSEEYAGIRDIIDGLLDEGPVAGISRLENQDRYMKAFLKQSQGRKLEADDYGLIYQLREHFDRMLDTDEDEPEEVEQNIDKQSCEEIIGLCDQLLMTEDCKKTISEAVKGGRYVSLAQFLELDCNHELIKVLKDDFFHGGYLVDVLMKDSDYVDAVVDIVREHLPMGKNHMEKYILEHVIMGLRAYPKKGEDLIESGLSSDVPRIRFVSVAVLDYWVKLTGEKLGDISPQLYHRLETMSGEEEDEKILEKLKCLVAE
ncbi:MAG: hypothetical protein IJX85_01315 [Lachnospiraceae bacterium]|nr:hypothetical protein [Lachnospiraceae bacterium]